MSYVTCVKLCCLSVNVNIRKKTTIFIGNCKINYLVVDSLTFDFVNEISRYKSSKMVDLSSPKAQEIYALIKENKIVIFSKTYCPYCDLAKECFDKIGVPYLAVELNKRGDGNEVQSILSQMTGARTVPRVFVKEKCIGGGTDVESLLHSGELAKIVA
ncbi:unnamed protein product [Phyllotreta striolata]|uniref:Glutaredoxin-2, mitochondrial n=1 Tax=Phyllotreta striolata TaxID=444603 RepID=A0A9N9TJC3_PHYSR|nr:unnamed protein product [Phyllotreta striolata]